MIFAHQVSPNSRLLISTIALSTMLASCVPPTTIDLAELDCKATSPVLELKQTENIKISVRVDATPSMRGYTSFASSQYIQALRSIDSVAYSSWAANNSSVKYYQFGTRLKEISKAGYIQAMSPGFYSGASPEFGVSQINAAIPKSQPDSLDIIVTDLYQKDSDVTLLQDKLNQSFLKQDYAVGILAMRSEFQGTVYSEGLAKGQFEYATTKQASNKFRPFYVLILGKYGNVKHFYEQLSQYNPDLTKDSRFNIFYAKPTLKTTYLEFPLGNTTDNPGVKRVKTINNGKVMVKAGKTEPIDFLLLKSKTNQDSVTYTVPYTPLPYLLEVIPQSDTNVVGQVYNSKTKKLEQTTAGNKILRLDGLQVSNSQIQLQAFFDPAAADKNVYFLSSNLFPGQFKKPTWWKEWSSNEGGRDGSKTDNLESFLDGLRSSTTALMKADQYPLSRLCFVIHKS